MSDGLTLEETPAEQARLRRIAEADVARDTRIAAADGARDARLGEGEKTRRKRIADALLKKNVQFGIDNFTREEVEAEIARRKRVRDENIARLRRIAEEDKARNARIEKFRNNFTREELLAEQARRKRIKEADAASAARLAGGTQPQSSAEAVSPTDAPPEADPLANVPTEIDGATLTPELRQAVLEGQQLEDPKERRLASARIAGRLAAQKDGGTFAERFNRGPFGAALRGFGAGLFGLGDLMSAGGTFIEGQFSDNEISFGEALEMQREFRRALEEDFPITSFAGELGGALVGGGAAVQGARAVAQVAPRLIGRAISSATTLERGQRSLNVLRLSGAGAVGGATTEGITEGDPGGGAVMGAVGGPLGAGLVRAAQLGAKVPGAIRTLLADPQAKGIKALAKKLNEPESEIAQRFLEFEAVMGRPPAISDIASPQAAAELRSMIAENSVAVGIVRDLGDVATQRRPREVSRLIKARGETTSLAVLEGQRKRASIKQFAKADNDIIRFTPEEVTDLLNDPDLLSAIPRTLDRRIGEKIRNVPPGEGLELTGLDVGDLRLALKARAKGKEGADLVFRELKNEIQAIGGRESAAFKDAVDNFAAASREIEGFTTGRRVSTAETSEFLGVVEETTSKEFKTGLPVGARTSLTDSARESAVRADSLSRALAGDSGLIERLRSILKPEEVERLIRLGKVQARSAENVGTLAPGVRASDQVELRSIITDSVSAAVVASGNTGGAFKANVIQKMLSRLIPRNPRVVESLARDAFDPTKTDKVLAALRRAQVPEEDILDLYATALAGGTVTALQLDRER